MDFEYQMKTKLAQCGQLGGAIPGILAGQQNMDVTMPEPGSAFREYALIDVLRTATARITDIRVQAALILSSLDV